MATMLDLASSDSHNDSVNILLSAFRFQIHQTPLSPSGILDFSEIRRS